MSQRNLNPYDPALPSDRSPHRRPRWTRSLLILNLVLIAIPISLVSLAYVSIQIDLRQQADSYSHGPVTYETDFVAFSGPVWPMLVYFAVPNGILLAYLAYRNRSHRKENGSVSRGMD